MTFKGWVDDLRIVDVAGTLKRLAFDLDLNIKLTIDKRLLRETVYYEVEGDASKIRVFYNLI